jgi:molybdopterin-guanine dinucleotide biosynthesis protein A
MTPELTGLVLAGGQSRRMGADKGALVVHGRTQAEYCLDLLATCCATARVSVRPSQATIAPYADLPLVLDGGDRLGPAAGLLAAWDRDPSKALLVIAVDLPYLSAAMLADLVRRRDPAAAATAFRHADGVIEPLCTIWEPRLRAVVAAAGPNPSLRRILEGADVRTRPVPGSRELRNINTPAALAEVRGELACGGRKSRV